MLHGLNKSCILVVFSLLFMAFIHLNIKLPVLRIEDFPVLLFNNAQVNSHRQLPKFSLTFVHQESMDFIFDLISLRVKEHLTDGRFITLSLVHQTNSLIDIGQMPVVGSRRI